MERNGGTAKTTENVMVTMMIGGETTTGTIDTAEMTNTITGKGTTSAAVLETGTNNQKGAIKTK